MTTTTTPAPSRRRWWALGLIAAAQFMVIMDTSIIGVALPRMQEDLGFTPSNLSWVFNAYVIAFGGLLLLGGRLSDLFGARRLFVTGWVILLVGSVVAGAAGNVMIELSGRVIQGAGAALIAPSALTLLMMLFGATPKELTRALALYGAAAPAGGTAGVFLGGLITEYASWPWVFYVNIPVAIVAIFSARSLLPGGSGGARGSIDILGALTATLGLGALVYGIVRAPEAGWGSLETLIAVGGGVLLIVLFLVIQARSRNPLMPLSIFRAPRLGAANVAQFFLGGAWIPMWFFLNLYLQQVLGYSAFPSGAALLPMTALVMLAMIVLAPRVIARFGMKMPIVAGLLLLAAGLGWLSMVRPDGTYLVDVLPASLVAALGMSLAFIPSLGTAISAARPDEGGLASGIVNTSCQVGSALGLAAMTAVAASFGADRIGDLPALTEGYSAAFLGSAAVALVGGMLTLAFFRRSRSADVSASDRDEEPAMS